MKKIIYSAAAMVLAFFAASCQQENLEPVATDNTVTYTVEVPGALSTKALGEEATGVDKVYYEVYRANQVETGSPVYEGEAAVTAGTASFDLEFVKQQEYVVLFWAQNSNLVYTGEGSTGMYDIADLRAVELKNAGASNNVNAQVFAGKDTVRDCVSAAGGAVELERPISQLNVFTTKESLMFGTKSITLLESTVTVKGIYTTYNVAEGNVVTTVDPATKNYTYSEFAVPTVLADNADLKYVAMNYVGFAPKEGVTVDVEFTITTEDDGSVNHKVSSVPVKPNYRTNIVGNLLTEAADYDVTLDADWADEEYTEVVVSTASDLQTTINEAPTNETVEISLSGDINLGDLAALLSTKSNTSSNTLSVPEGKSIVLNLNGYSISGVDETNAAYALIFNYGNLSIVNTADKVSKLTVKATVESGWSRRSAVISTESKSTLYVGKGVEIEHLGGTSMSYGIDILTNGGNGDVNATIDGAVVKSSYRAIRQFLNSDSKMNSLTIKKDSEITSTKGNKSVWMQDASAKANRGSLVVEAGAKLMTDAYLDVTAGSTAWPVTVSIAKSALKGEATVVAENVPALYDVVLKDGIWTVETSFTFAEFVDAVIAAEGTYDGEGKTVKILPLSGKSDNTNGCLIPNRLQKYSNPDVYYAQYQRFAELQDVNISNVNFVFVPAAITVQDAWNTAGATTTAENVNGELQFMNSGSVTLTGCTFDKVAVSPINAPALTVADCQFSDLMAYAIKDVKAATVSITGTEFNNCNGGFWFANAPTTVTVTNNTFTEVGRRGAIQFSADGDYANTTLNISGNTVDGIFLWQLNETITEAQLKPVLENNTYTTDFTEDSKVPVDYAKIGDKVYKSLQAAIEAVQEGETVVLLKDLAIETPAYGQNALNYARAINFTLDLNGKTLSADTGNSVFRYNITQAGATDDVTVTIKNGTITAGEKTWCVVMAAGLSADVRAVYNLEDLTINASKPGDLAVKAWDYALINAKNVIVNATKGAGGFYAVGGEIVLDNCTVNQEGLWTAPYLSMAVAVSTGGKATVNSGTYTAVPTAASEGNNQGTSHGSWAAGVMNSGGELIINGGTFANGNFGDDALATAARGLIFGDTASKIVINDGTFNALKSIIDYQNNLGVQPNPNIVINGGNFSADPSVVTSYGGVVIKEGFTTIKGADGRWTLVEGNFIKSEAALKAAFENGGEIVLGADVTISNPVVLAEGKTAVLDLNGMKINAAETTGNHIYAIENYGTLTIADNSAKKEGSINSRGIYNYNKLTLESGKVSAIDGNGGYAVNNKSGSTFIMNGGWIAADYEDGDAPAAGNYDATALNVPSGSKATLNAGKITNAGNFTYAVAAAGTLNIPETSTIEILGRHGAVSVSGGETTINAGKYSIYENTDYTDNVLYVYGSGKMVINGGTFIGDQDDANGGSCVYDSVGGVTINGGVFRNSSGGDVWGTTGTVIKGGKFENLTETSRIAEGYEMNASGEVVAK